MFSQACVKNSVHKGEGVSDKHPLCRHTPRLTHPWADTPSLGRSPPPGPELPCRQTPPGQTHPWTNTHPGQTAPLQHTTTAADGTYPTGIHSCWNKISFLTVEESLNDTTLEGTRLKPLRGDLSNRSFIGTSES